jgi:hypothetical protein
MSKSTILLSLMEGDPIEWAWHEPEPGRVCSLFARTLPFYVEEAIAHRAHCDCGDTMEVLQTFMTTLKNVEQYERELSVLCRQYREREIGSEQFFKELAAVTLKLQEAAGRSR